ncbi:hypothetical protein [Acinetobacter baumannii]
MSEANSVLLILLCFSQIHENMNQKIALTNRAKASSIELSERSEAKTRAIFLLGL